MRIRIYRQVTRRQERIRGHMDIPRIKRRDSINEAVGDIYSHIC